MNISPVNSVSLLKNFNYKTNEKIIRYSLPFDSVSFSGKKNVTKQEFSENAQEGITIGKKILKLARSNSLKYETLNNLINENAPVPINIDNIDNMPNIARDKSGKTIAHMLPGYTPDLKLAVATIYIGSIPKTSKEESDFAANIAHEYTHVLQRAKNDNYYGITKYTKNPAEVTVIARTSQAIMNEMLNICQRQLFTNEKEVRTVINSILNNRFNIEKSLGVIDFNEIINGVSFKLAQQLKKSPEDMKNAVKGWIIQEAQNEKEAYSVTLDVLERSKYDPQTKASRTLSKEMYSYINKSLKN